MPRHPPSGKLHLSDDSRAKYVVGTSNARRGPADNAFSHFGQIRMKRPGPSFVVGTSNARRGPADNAFSHFGQIRMKRPGPSFVVGTSNARRGPADNAFSHFGQIRMKCPGPSFVIGTSNARRGPADNAFSHSSSLRHHIFKQVPSSLPLCWQVANTSGHQTAHVAITSVAMVIQSGHSNIKKV
jgi:hypothetical protein